jgi:AcrR family transcriptional regulator
MEATEARANNTATKRPRNPQGEGSRLRDELIAAASRLLAAGIEPGDLSLRAVAKEAMVAAPSVYLQFENKDSLMRAVVLDHFARFRHAVEAAVTQGHDPVSRLLYGCLAYGQFAREQPGSFRIIFETSDAEWGAPNPEEPIGLDTFMILVNSVEECMETGVARPGDPFQTAIDIWVSLHGMASLRQRMPDFPWPAPEVQVARVLVDLTGIPAASLVPLADAVIKS